MTGQQKGGKALVDKYGSTWMSTIGKVGGETLVEKRGSEYMRRIGSLGGRKTADKFGREPFGTSDFLIVEKATGKVCRKTLNGNFVPKSILETRGEYKNGKD